MSDTKSNGEGDRLMKNSKREPYKPDDGKEAYTQGRYWTLVIMQAVIWILFVIIVGYWTAQHLKNKGKVPIDLLLWRYGDVNGTLVMAPQSTSKLEVTSVLYAIGAFGIAGGFIQMLLAINIPFTQKAKKGVKRSDITQYMHGAYGPNMLGTGMWCGRQLLFAILVSMSVVVVSALVGVRNQALIISVGMFAAFAFLITTFVHAWGNWDARQMHKVSYQVPVALSLVTMGLLTMAYIPAFMQLHQMAKSSTLPSPVKLKEMKLLVWITYWFFWVPTFLEVLRTCYMGTYQKGKHSKVYAGYWPSISYSSFHFANDIFSQLFVATATLMVFAYIAQNLDAFVYDALDLGIFFP